MNSSPNQKIQNMSQNYIIWSTKCIFEKISKLFLSCRKIRSPQLDDQKCYPDFEMVCDKMEILQKIKSFDFLFYSHVKALIE